MLSFLEVIMGFIERILRSELTKRYKPVVAIESSNGNIVELTVHNPHYDALDDLQLIKHTGVKPHTKTRNITFKDILKGMELFNTRYSIITDAGRVRIIDMTSERTAGLLKQLSLSYSVSDAFIKVATYLVNAHDASVVIAPTSITIQVKTSDHVFVCYARYANNAHVVSLSLMGDNNILGIGSGLIPKCCEMVSISEIDACVIYPKSIETNQNASLESFDLFKQIKQLLKPSGESV